MQRFLFWLAVVVLLAACQKEPPVPDLYIGAGFQPSNWVEPKYVHGNSPLESSAGYWLREGNEKTWIPVTIIYASSSTFNLIPANVPLRIAIPADGAVGFFPIVRFSGNVNSIDPPPKFPIEAGDFVEYLESPEPKTLVLGVSWRGEREYKPVLRRRFGSTKSFNYIEFDIYENVVIPPGEYFVTLIGVGKYSKLLFRAQ